MLHSSDATDSTAQPVAKAVAYLGRTLLAVPLAWIFWVSLAIAVTASVAIAAAVSVVMVGNVAPVIYVAASVACALVASCELLILVSLIKYLRDQSDKRSKAESQTTFNLAVTSGVSYLLRLSLTEMPIHSLLEVALDCLLALPGLELDHRGCIFIATPDGQSLRLACHRGMPSGIIDTCMSLDMGQCLCGRAAAEMKTLYVPNGHSDLCGQAHYCIPILNGSELIGVINVMVTDDHVPHPHRENTLETFADTLAGILVRRGVEGALQDSEEISRTLMNASLDGEMLLDRSGVVLAANAAMAARFDLAPDTIVGRPLPRAFSLFKWDQVLSSGQPLRVEDEHADRIYDNRIYPVSDKDGRTSSVAVFSRDITEQIESRKTIERTLAELARSNSDLEQFAYVTSHDLRQPLRMISSYLELVEEKMGTSIDPELKQYMAFATGGARRMDRLILDLLDYSRIGRVSGEVTTEPLSAIIEDSLLNLKVAIDEAKAEITVADGLPNVRGYASELVRLFQNLIGNSVKYRSPERPPTIAIDWKDGGADWILSVSDNGIGIDPEQRDRVFAIFQRLVRPDQYEGTGIGLAVCRKIVEHHGGRIWIESNVDGGSIFYVSLPKIEAVT